MLKHAVHILAEALELPPVERAELVENILSKAKMQQIKDRYRHVKTS